jgi:class 3 adenylate cyclase/tetratricopeptide (TPR) repeat protein
MGEQMNESHDQSSFMPQGYGAKMRAARRERAMRGERRIITMLFCDVVGSTAMASQLDPEEWAEIMNEAFEFLITPIYRYEGTVARLQGDAILAFFGAPIAHEDDPQRAILAGMAIVEGIKSFAAEIREDYGLEFNVRVGINTGPVVVGEVGTDLALEYTAMGDAINLASRMESTAEVGTVQITANTYELVAPLFDVRDAGKIAVKGKDDPVQAYSVGGLKARPGRLRGIGGLRTPLVGRGQELERLKQLVNGLKQGQGQIICLSGEAGLGKSRLIADLQREFRADLVAENFGWIEGPSISYDSAQPYGAIMQMFRMLSGVSRSDPADVARQKIRTQVSSFVPGVRESMAHALEILLQIEGVADQPGPEGEALQRELFAAFLTTWRDTANNIPLVAVFDDLQWADAASVKLLSHLLQLVETTPSIFICSYRPYRQSSGLRIEEVAASSYADHFTAISLKPLAHGESREMANSLMAAADVPEALYEKILERADGNPFFIEEVVRALIDGGVLAREEGGLRWRSSENVARIEIPDNVLALLVARIDRLDKDSKQIVQLAAVIGRSFYKRVLERISGAESALEDHLLELQEMGLIREEPGTPEPSYAFRHALTRDAAYQSILHRQRRRYHRRVAETLEELFGHNLAEEAHQLAYHFNEARKFEKGLFYFTMAGDQAARLYANSEAIELYGRAIELAQENGSEEQIVHLYKSRGRTFELLGRYEEALAEYKALEKVAHERDNQHIKLEALMAETTLLSTFTDQFDLDRGATLLPEALALAEALGDRRAQAKIYWNMMLQGSYGQVDAREIVPYGETAVAIAREENLREELAYALNDLARPYTQVGEMGKASSVLEEAGQLWRELGNKPMLADNRATLASGFRYLGRLEEGLEIAQEALEISRAIGNYWGEAYSMNVLGPIYLELGRIDEALDSWQRSIPVAIKAKFMGGQAFVRLDMGVAYGYLGDAAKGLALVRESFGKTIELGHSPLVYYPLLAQAHLHLYDGNVEAAVKILTETRSVMERLRMNMVASGLLINIESEVGFATGRYEETAAMLEEAISRAENMGLTLSLVELWLLKGQALVGLNRAAEAEAVLTEARRVAESIGSKKLLWQILGALYEIAVGQGRPEEAEVLRREAQEVIAFIAGHISDAQLKRSFLNRTAVKKIF